MKLYFHINFCYFHTIFGYGNNTSQKMYIYSKQVWYKIISLGIISNQFYSTNSVTDTTYFITNTTSYNNLKRIKFFKGDIKINGKVLNHHHIRFFKGDIKINGKVLNHHHEEMNLVCIAQCSLHIGLFDRSQKYMGPRGCIVQ